MCLQFPTKEDNLRRTQKQKLKKAFSTIIKKTHQLQSIKSNKEVTPKILESYFLYRKPQKLKFVKNVFENCLQKVPYISRIVPTIRQVGSCCINNKLGVAFKNGLRWIKAFFLRTFFHSALAILEPQIYIVVENSLGRKISRCSTGVLFVNITFFVLA